MFCHQLDCAKISAFLIDTCSKIQCRTRQNVSQQCTCVVEIGNNDHVVVYIFSRAWLNQTRDNIEKLADIDPAGD